MGAYMNNPAINSPLVHEPDVYVTTPCAAWFSLLHQARAPWSSYAPAATHLSFTDLACANGLATPPPNPNPPVVTSASYAFKADDVGSFIQITAGANWIAGAYRIVSVAAGAATLDRACGTVNGLTNGTFYQVNAAYVQCGRATHMRISVTASPTPPIRRSCFPRWQTRRALG